MNFANKISTFRILTVPFFIATLIYYSPEKEYLRLVALGIFALAVVSDAADGYIARKSKQQSKAGLVLDPLGDKLLLMSAFVGLSFDKFSPHFPTWVTLVVISRDLLILLGTLVIYMVKQNINIFPTPWGKFSTAFQMASVLAILLRIPFSFILWWGAVLFTAVSGAHYVRRGFQALYAVDNHRNSH